MRAEQVIYNFNQNILVSDHIFYYFYESVGSKMSKFTVEEVNYAAGFCLTLIKDWNKKDTASSLIKAIQKDELSTFFGLANDETIKIGELIIIFVENVIKPAYKNTKYGVLRET